MTVLSWRPTLSSLLLVSAVPLQQMRRIWRTLTCQSKACLTPGSLERGVWQRDCDKCRLCVAFLFVPFFFGSIVFIWLFNLAGPAHYSVWCSLFYDGYAYLFADYSSYFFFLYRVTTHLLLTGTAPRMASNSELNVIMRHQSCRRCLLSSLPNNILSSLFISTFLLISWSILPHLKMLYLAHCVTDMFGVTSQPKR